MGGYRVSRYIEFEVVVNHYCIPFTNIISLINILDTAAGETLWADPEGGQDVRTPLKNRKNIGFLCNTGPDPLKNHKATKPVFNVGLFPAKIVGSMFKICL